MYKEENFNRFKAYVFNDFRNESPRAPQTRYIFSVKSRATGEVVETTENGVRLLEGVGLNHGLKKDIRLLKMGGSMIETMRYEITLASETLLPVGNLEKRVAILESKSEKLSKLVELALDNNQKLLKLMEEKDLVLNKLMKQLENKN